MAKWITVQGTRSGVGKSVVTAKLVEILSEEHSVAPFKPLNFSKNSFPVENSEIGYSTYHQCREAGLEPRKMFAPLLVKTMENKTELITKDKVKVVSYGDLDRVIGENYSYIQDCIERLDREFDYVVWEGFGSMINSNMENNPNIDLIEKTGVEIILVDDISKGGVEASIKGIHSLLSKENSDRITLNIVNKASKKSKGFENTLQYIEEHTDTETVSLPYIRDLNFPEEDGIPDFNGNGEIAVISYPHVSNTSDLEFLPDSKTRMVENPNKLNKAELVILPGSKNTLKDYRWMKRNGITEKIKSISSETTVFGVCGGFQMMGKKIEGNKVEQADVKGLDLIEMETVFSDDKTLEKIDYEFQNNNYGGYRIHYGETDISNENLFKVNDSMEGFFEDGIGGTYIHDSLRNKEFLNWLLEKAGIDSETSGKDASEIKEKLRKVVDF